MDDDGKKTREEVDDMSKWDLRYFSPRELLLLHGFPSWFTFPPGKLRAAALPEDMLTLMGEMSP